MSNDTVIRAAAVVAAAALLAAPYRRQIVERIAQAAEAAKRHAALAGRLAAAALLIAAAWGKIPMPRLAVPPVPVTVATPSREMQSLVEPVGKALAGLPAADRNLWASLWTRAATVAAGDAVTAQVAFADTRSLREYTALAVDIGWRRIGQHVPGSQESLRTAVEAAYASAVGSDVVPVTGDVRARYVEFANAIGWAATR